MKKTALLIAGIFATGIVFAEKEGKPKDGDKPKHHGPPPFAKLDANNDGKVTFEEFKAHAPKDAPAEKVEAKFKKLDANGDGSITKEEFPKPGEGPKKHHGDKKPDAAN